MSLRFASSDGARIAYEVLGRGRDWVALVHGLGYARWGWGPVLGLLAEHFRVIALDNRGIGESDVPPGPYTAAQMARDVVAVLDDAGVARAHLVGTSLGGMIAQEVAIDHADRVDRLVLAGTTPGGDAGYPLPAATRRLIAQAAVLTPDVALRRFVENALAPSTVAERPELVAELVAHRSANPPPARGWQAQASAGSAYDGGGRQARIAAPTLVIHGADDRVVDPRNAAVLGAAIPGARVELLPGVGHLPFWEAPEPFAGLVTGFLRPRRPLLGFLKSRRG